MSVAAPAVALTRDFYVVSDGHYVYDCLTDGCFFEATRVRRDQYGELRCVLDVRTTLAGAMVLDDLGTLTRIDSINLSDSRRRRETALDLARRAKTRPQNLDWQSRLDELAFRISSAESRGQAAVWLPEVPRAIGDPIFTVEGFPLLREHPQIVFGDGGSLKSYLLLHWAGGLAKQGVRVMYADWELDESDHRERAAALWGSAIPQILYVRCSRPLVAEAERLSRLKHEHQIQFAFCDSISFACAGRPEDAEVAQDYFRACRSLAIGTMHAAHITGSTEAKEHRPFGSIFWHNGCRLSWFAKAEDETQDTSHHRTVALINRKANLSARRAALAYRFEFEPNMVRIAKTDPALVDTVASSLPQWQRIKAAVSKHPLTFAEIADETGLKEGSIRKSVERANRTFKVIEGANGLKKVALLELRAAT